MTPIVLALIGLAVLLIADGWCADAAVAVRRAVGLGGARPRLWVARYASSVS
jgi:hypothetical protein